MPDIFKDLIPACPTMIVIIENWIASYRKMGKTDRWKKEMEQLEQLITAAEVKQLDQSDHIAYCKTILRNVRVSGKPASFKEFISCRDYVLTYLCLNNASRTGALANMTCKEFLCCCQENGTYMVSVFNHKTVGTSGPAIICYTKDLYEEALIYLHKFRNGLDGMDPKRSR